MSERASEERTRPVIAIDGPVSAGKSTVARELAKELGFVYLNTGAMYRAVALKARAAGLQPDDPQLGVRLKPLLKTIEIRFAGERLLLDGRDVTAALAEPEIGDLASRLSTLAVVRERMRELQRAAGAAGGVVMEGRDIGTVVFPDAEFKFYLDAELEVRARRRFAELGARGEKTSLEQVREQLIERDRRDSSRELAPLKRARDAIVIDATDRTVAEVVATIRAHVSRRSRSVRA